MAAKLQQEHAGKSGFHLLTLGMDGFVARALLIDAAERTLDLQYYIISRGLTVDLLMEKIIRAARRGVRVRLLFDDLGLGLSDDELWLLDSHPNIEVRLFNPVPERRRGLLTVFSVLGNARRLNHRMHNKAFIVDDAVAIVGGRNLADEYFGAGENWNLADMGVFGVGPVANELSKSFDMYWNSDWSVPFSHFMAGQPDGEGAERACRELEDKNRRARNSDYVQGLRDSSFLKQLFGGGLPLDWARSQVLFDLPEKASEEGGPRDPSVYLGTHLEPLANGTSSELTLVSPYFVPGKQGMEVIRKMREKGVHIRILTNSMASTDVSSVHAGYMKYRKQLLAEGAELYEMVPDERGEKDQNERKTFLGSSHAGLHAKVYIFDRKTVFIGSRNLDPRSNLVNTEVGVIIESPAIAEQLTRAFDRVTSPEYAFKVTLAVSGLVTWSAEEDGKKVIYLTEPRTGFWRRLSVRLMSVFVPESLL